jgi:hypothetical protein
VKDIEKAEWLADKLHNGGDYGKEAAAMLVRQADEIKALRTSECELRGALQELRIRLHALGRRPDECYEMSYIDDALSQK